VNGDAPTGGEDDRDESAAGEHHDPPRDCIDRTLYDMPQKQPVEAVA
jgi:hypothetical protein